LREIGLISFNAQNARRYFAKSAAMAKFRGASVGTGVNPVSNATADLDGDGNADLVVAEFNGSTASILLNSGEGFIDISAASATGTIANDDRATVSDSTDNDYLADIGKLALLLG
jgi:hypothetical protein